MSWLTTFLLEVAINVTVPTSHFLYCFWSYHLDDIKAKLGTESPMDQTTEETNRGNDDLPSLVGSSVSISERTDAEAAYQRSIIASKLSPPGSPTLQREDRKTDKGTLPKQYRIEKVENYLLLGFFLGLFVLAYIPLVYLPECDDPLCLHRSYVAKTSILTESKELFEGGKTTQELLKTTPGLLELNVGRIQHEVSSDKFFMVEKWDAEDSMTEDVLQRFTGSSSSDAFADTPLDIATVSTKTCPQPSVRFGSIEVKPRYSCKKLWRVLDSPVYCAWIPGCKFISTDTAPEAKLFLDDGTVLPAAVVKNKGKMKIDVSVLSSNANAKLPPGYAAQMTLEKSGTGLFPWSKSNRSCKLKYDFRVDVTNLSSPSGCADYFNQHFLPDLYTKLSQK